MISSFNAANCLTNITELAQISRLTRNDDDEKILRSMNKQGSWEHISIDMVGLTTPKQMNTTCYPSINIDGACTAAVI